MSHRDDKKQVTTKNHDVYFFPDGDLFVRVRHSCALSLGLNVPFPQVENTLFRIDKHFLTRESTKLRSRILDPIYPSRDPPGSSDSKPFTLEEATSEGFESLLWVFYNQCGTIHSCILSIDKLIHVTAIFLTKLTSKNGNRSCTLRMFGVSLGL